MKTIQVDGVAVIPGDEAAKRLPEGTYFKIKEDGGIEIALPDGEKLREGDKIVVVYEIGPLKRSNGERKG